MRLRTPRHAVATIAGTVLCLVAPEASAQSTDTEAASRASPGERSAHGMVYDEGLGQVVLIGGIPGDGDGDVWAWNGESWARHVSEAGMAGVDGPDRRGHFALAFDPDSSRILLHGGFLLDAGQELEGRFGELWSWKNGEWARLHSEETGPGVRDHHAMIWDRARGELVLFGGGRGVPGDQTLLGDTWIYRDGRWREVEGTSPPARATHRLAYDEQRERVVLFGGWGEAGLLADTWEWDGEQWEQIGAEGPEPRFAARLAYDASIERVVLYGGRAAGGDLGDTWEWDGQRWTRSGGPPADSEGPGPRNVHALAYDAARERLVMYGGLANGARRADTWERRGRQWVLVARPDH